MKKYDLLVVGGGLTGVAAAVSGAREGLSVLLVEKSGSLGGAMTNNLVFPFMRYWYPNEDGTNTFLSRGIFEEMHNRAKKYDPSITLKEFKPEDFKFVLDNIVTEAGVDILFHTTVFEVIKNNREIIGVRATTGSGSFEINADFFVDATGDGNIFYLAGCDFKLGRESDGYSQPMTTCFRMCGVDLEAYRQEHGELNRIYNELQKEGKIKNPRENILTMTGIGDGILHLNTTRIIKLDPTNVFDLSRAEIEARRQVHEMVDFLRTHSKAFEKATIISIATEIGVRESRKLIGEHVLTVEEMKALTKFEDRIAVGNYDVDIHNPTGSGTTHFFFKHGDYYTIPYRSLLPKEYDNLLVAGRCLSATHEAQSSTRIMPICTCLGEAAGCAIAIAKKTNTNTHTVDIKTVQETLRKNGAVID